jgi:hypothetical protein
MLKEISKWASNDLTNIEKYKRKLKKLKDINVWCVEKLHKKHMDII